jgi:hypothetical protein
MTARALKDVRPEGQDPAGIPGLRRVPTRGWTGMSTRFAFKVLSATFNYDQTEIAADPVHLMYVLEQAIAREHLAEETREALRRAHQGRPRAALRRVHRQGDPEGLSRIVLRVRPEPLRPLRDLRRLPGSRIRTTSDPETGESFDRASCSTAELDEDREAGRDRQSEGLPERDRQVRRSARARATPAEPCVDELREAARGDREEDVLEHARTCCR